MGFLVSMMHQKFMLFLHYTRAEPQFHAINNPIQMVLPQQAILHPSTEALLHSSDND